MPVARQLLRWRDSRTRRASSAQASSVRRPVFVAAGTVPRRPIVTRLPARSRRTVARATTTSVRSRRASRDRTRRATERPDARPRLATVTLALRAALGASVFEAGASFGTVRWGGRGAGVRRAAAGHQEQGGESDAAGREHAGHARSAPGAGPVGLARRRGAVSPAAVAENDAGGL